MAFQPSAIMVEICLMIKTLNSKYEFLSSLFGPAARGPYHLLYWLSPGFEILPTELNKLLSFDAGSRPVDSIIPLESDKTDKRNRVMRFKSNGISYIAKIFRMRNIKDCFKNKKFAFSELKNNHTAAMLGIVTPRCYAYFEQRPMGIIRQTGLIMEDLNDFTEFRHLLSCGKLTIFDVIPVINELFHKGVNHIDFSPKNILYRPGDKRYAIIDWQYCSFYPSSNDLQLCLAAAMFYNKLNSEDALCRRWLEILYNQCRPGITFDKMQRAVSAMQNRRLTRTARLNLDVSGLGLEGVW